MRTPTVHSFHPDAVELTIDCVAGETGVAASWAAGAQSGDAVGLNTPRGCTHLRLT